MDNNEIIPIGNFILKMYPLNTNDITLDCIIIGGTTAHDYKRNYPVVDGRWSLSYFFFNGHYVITNYYSELVEPVIYKIYKEFKYIRNLNI